METFPKRGEIHIFLTGALWLGESKSPGVGKIYILLIGLHLFDCLPFFRVFFSALHFHLLGYLFPSRLLSFVFVVVSLGFFRFSFLYRFSKVNHRMKDNIFSFFKFQVAYTFGILILLSGCNLTKGLRAIKNKI